MSSKQCAALMKIAAVSVSALMATIDIVAFNMTAPHCFPPVPGHGQIWFNIVCTLPWFVVLHFVWRVADAVKNETVFTMKTARYISSSVLIILVDTAALVLGNIVLIAQPFYLDKSFDIFWLSMLVAIVATVLALLAAVLSRYIAKAAELKDEVEGTV